jgi:starch synthase
MKICIISPEIVPYAKTGGLADMTGALGKYLSLAGHEVRMVMPLYGQIDREAFDLAPVEIAQDIDLSFLPGQLKINVYSARMPGSQADVFFIEQNFLYNRPKIYTTDGDEALRFAVLTAASIVLCQRLGWAPDIFHLNDWQTALLPVYLKSIYHWDLLFLHSKTLLTIHNIGYQGLFSADTINQLGLAAHFAWFDSGELYSGRLNFLKTGILHADWISTVSVTYSHEIQTPEYGEGLDELLRYRSNHLTGILNGVDYDTWNPAVDPFLPMHYGAGTAHLKQKIKMQVFSDLGLEKGENAPLLTMISRLVHQKGISLLHGTLEWLLINFEVRVVILGEGEAHFENYLHQVQHQFPGRFVFVKGYNNALSHQLEAAADIFLMPSLYEPCGLNQIYSLKYGTVPVVRKTGGLADTVELYNWEKQTGTGFVFDAFSQDSLRWALEYALTTFNYKESWKKLMRNGMMKDYSWDIQIHHYLRLYDQVVSL